MNNTKKVLGTQSSTLLSALCAIALAAVIGFSFAACTIDASDGGGNSDPNTSINGTWRMGSGTTRISISGSTGVVTQLGNSWSTVGQSAVDKGYVKVGTQFFRYLSKTGDRSWTGQRLLFNSYDSAPNVCVDTSWSETGTITMDSNGKSFVFSGNSSDGVFTNTFYRD
jgi:hypothetical protein